MRIAILGATSQIAKDLVLSFSADKKYRLALFARRVAFLKEWVKDNALHERCDVHEYAEFGVNQDYDIVINFVGVGDPARAKEMASDIFTVTEKYDNIALDYIKHHTQTKYIFLSSGAVYGGNHQEPANKNTVAEIDINNLNLTDWYAIAKLYTEAKHRSLNDLFIVDVRVFNYFSHTQDMNARFLITDIVRSLRDKKVLKTSPDNIVRDFITPPDFYTLVQAIIDFEPINMALDCYTIAPVSKLDLLSKLESEFGLRYEIDKSANVVNATGAKLNYYSTNKNTIGYQPKNTSLSGILDELSKLQKI